MLRFLQPHRRLSHVLQISADDLRSWGIDGLLLDLDGTLKDYKAVELPTPVLKWIKGLQDAQIRLCLLSNGKIPRIERFARILGVPFVAKAFKPLPHGVRRALRLLELERSRAAVVGDQLFADVLAGRLAGVRTILVPPTHRPSEEPWFTRVKRPLERLALWGLPDLSRQEYCE